jgi:hypothetical protein
VQFKGRGDQKSTLLMMMMTMMMMVVVVVVVVAMMMTTMVMITQVHLRGCGMLRLCSLRPRGSG